jgi:glucan phosphoethanolaminetransferase (alkaline phosphatase superfamily)
MAMGFSGQASFWSFMVDFHVTTIKGWGRQPQFIAHNGRFFLNDFWFGSFVQNYGEVSSALQTPVGVNFGWFLVFLLQASALVVWFAQLVKPLLPKRGLWSLMVLVFPWASFIMGLAQCQIHSNIEYHQFGNAEAIPYFGLWIASVSVVLLSISYWRSPETETLKRFGLRKLALTFFFLSVIAFLLFNEAEFQTKVTKLMYVQRTVENGELPGDPQKWTADFNRIAFIAEIFRARVIYNTPEYYYCELEVPAVSYGTLISILSSVGYYAKEPIFLHLN